MLHIAVGSNVRTTNPAIPLENNPSPQPTGCLAGEARHSRPEKTSVRGAGLAVDRGIHKDP